MNRHQTDQQVLLNECPTQQYVLTIQFAHKIDEYLEHVDVPVRDNPFATQPFKQTIVWIELLSQNTEIPSHHSSPVKIGQCACYWRKLSHHSISGSRGCRDAAAAAAAISMYLW